MIIERAVYNLQQEIVGYMIFKQYVKEPVEIEHFMGFKKVN